MNKNVMKLKHNVRMVPDKVSKQTPLSAAK